MLLVTRCEFTNLICKVVNKLRTATESKPKKMTPKSISFFGFDSVFLFSWIIAMLYTQSSCWKIKLKKNRISLQRYAAFKKANSTNNVRFVEKKFLEFLKLKTNRKDFHVVLINRYSTIY